MSTMTMIVPPECQGQIVEVSYGWFEGSLYRRTRDRSDGTDLWSVADERGAAKLAETSWHPVNSAPPLGARRWKRCADPMGEDAGDAVPPARTFIRRVYKCSSCGQRTRESCEGEIETGICQACYAEADLDLSEQEDA